MTKKQADDVGVPPEGPYKPGHHRYFPFPKLPPARGSDSLGGMKPMNWVAAPVDFVLVTAPEEERIALFVKFPDCQPPAVRATAPDREGNGINYHEAALDELAPRSSLE